MENIILASTSPRRQEILKMMHIPFQVIVPNVDESLYTSKNPEEIPELLARAKVQSVVHSLPPKQVIPWVLGADTLVIMDNEIYGKPQNHEEAEQMLKSLAGNTHKVVTSVALYNGRSRMTTVRTSITSVTFAPMTDEEISWYIDTGDWHGVAGGYRIQGLASCFITKIDGAYSCVMGLPIFELYDMLKKQGYSIIE